MDSTGTPIRRGNVRSILEPVSLISRIDFETQIHAHTPDPRLSRTQAATFGINDALYAALRLAA